MNRVEEYLNTLDKKELIYIFLSIPIIVFIVYYNFIYPNITKHHTKLIKENKSMKKTLLKVSMEIRKTKNSKKAIIPIQKKLENLQEDYKYIKYSFNNLQIIQLSNKKIYKLLSHLLQKSTQLNLTNSLDIDWNEKKPPFSRVVNILITGNGNYLSIIKYLQYIEHLNKLIHIKTTKIYINSDEKKVIKAFIEQKKEQLNNITFSINKHNSDSLNYLKYLANNYDVKISISIDKTNINNFIISFKGHYSNIQSLYQRLQNDIASKKLFTSNIKTSFYIPKMKNNIKLQKFLINFEIVGVKWAE